MNENWKNIEEWRKNNRKHANPQSNDRIIQGINLIMQALKEINERLDKLEKRKNEKNR